MRKGKQDEGMRVKDKDGNMLVEGNAVRKRWAEYFDELMNVEDDLQESIVEAGGD